jgi:hypothetical protein
MIEIEGGITMIEREIGEGKDVETTKTRGSGEGKDGEMIGIREEERKIESVTTVAKWDTLRPIVGALKDAVTKRGGHTDKRSSPPWPTIEIAQKEGTCTKGPGRRPSVPAVLRQRVDHPGLR